MFVASPMATFKLSLEVVRTMVDGSPIFGASPHPSASVGLDDNALYLVVNYKRYFSRPTGTGGAWQVGTYLIVARLRMIRELAARDGCALRLFRVSECPSESFLRQ